jgi:hypothetical protein
MRVVDHVAEVIWTRARFVSVLSLENVTLAPVYPAHEQRNALTNRVHETREGLRALTYCEVEMVCHDRKRDEPRVRALQCIAHDANDRRA